MHAIWVCKVVFCWARFTSSRKVPLIKYQSLRSYLSSQGWVNLDWAWKSTFEIFPELLVTKRVRSSFLLIFGIHWQHLTSWATPVLVLVSDHRFRYTVLAYLVFDNKRTAYKVKYFRSMLWRWENNGNDKNSKLANVIS